jgi:peptidylprolyl isomerase
MRTRHLIACGLAALSLAAAGCSEEEAEESASTPETAEPEGAAAEPAPSEPAEPEGAPSEPTEVKGKPKVTVPEGPAPAKLEIEDIEEGTGPAAEAGSQISVNYVGVNYSDGEEFDSSFNTGAPFDFQLGAGMVIPGWDQGLEGMKVGGRRQLVIPPELAYGPQGSPPAIGPGETLVFVIDLLGVQ